MVNAPLMFSCLNSRPYRSTAVLNLTSSFSDRACYYITWVRVLLIYKEGISFVFDLILIWFDRNQNKPHEKIFDRLWIDFSSYSRPDERDRGNIQSIGCLWR